MRLSIQQTLLFAFGGLTVLLSGALVALSLQQEAHLVRGVSAEMLINEQDKVNAALHDVFEPVDRALTIALRRIEMGTWPTDDARLDTQLKDLLLPSMRELDHVGSMMVGDITGYQWLLMRYDQSALRSPLLVGAPGLPPVTQPKSYLTREFRPLRWGQESRWTIWDVEGREPKFRFRRVLPGYDPRKRAWYIAALARLEAVEAGTASPALESRATWSDVYTLFTSKTPGFSATAAIRDATGKVVIVAYDVLLEALSEFTRMRRPTASGQVFVISDAGNVLGLPQADRFEDESTRLAELMQPLTAIGGEALARWTERWQELRDTSEAPFAYDVDGATWWGSFRPFHLDGAPKLWVGVAVPQQELIALVGHEPSRIVWISLLALLLAVALASWIARAVSRPIQQIAEQSQRVGELELSYVDGPPTHLAEVNDLIEALRKMREALFEYVQRSSKSHGELQASEERFRSTFELAGIGILHTALDGTIVFVNDKLAEILGRAKDSLIGTYAFELSHPDDRQRELARIKRLLDGDTRLSQWEKRYVRGDGSLIWGHVTVGLRRDGHGDPLHFVAVIQDISERKSLEERLRQAQKLEAVGRLAGGVAHDFNNLLTVIVGYASLARESLPANHPAQDDLQEIEQATQSAAALTRQLLTYARKDVAVPRVIDVAASIRDNEKLLSRLIGEHIRLIVRVAPGRHAVFIDPVHLQQVMVNLVVNARDAMPRGGQVEIGLRQVEAMDGTKVVEIRVADSGVGMDAAVQAHIFEPFFTTKEVGQGTGLGLSTCYGIVREAGGSIEVDSEEGVGSTFRILLPVTELAMSDADAKVPLSESVGQERVLVVEDEPQIRMLMEQALRRAGFMVYSAADGAAALRLVEAGAQIDLLVTDVVMPLTNGGELAAMLQRMVPDLAVLFVSGYSREVLGDRIPADIDLLIKPFGTDDVVRQVRRVLDRRSRAN